MKRLRIFLFIFCLSAALLVRPAALRAQQFALSEAAPDRTAELRAEVEFLCDSLCAGRGFGTVGAQAATLYLLRQLRDAGLRTTVQSFAAGGRVGHNVVAVTPGWFRRYIVVGAYFDGLGTLDGRIYPGADANASGVAAMLGCSRRMLETHYRAFYGQSVGEAILARRFAEVERLLDSPHQALEPIANLCGWKSPAHLMRSFKRRYGMTMSNWRKASELWQSAAVLQ